MQNGQPQPRFPGSSLHSEPLVITLFKDATDLLKRIDFILADTQADGRLESLIEKPARGQYHCQ